MLVVLVVKDGAQWLPQCLLALSRQTHPRIGVLAVDNASTDGSAALLEAALGPERVLRLERNEGFGGSVRRALENELARRADYVLFLHDDTVLAPQAVARMVEAAEAVEGCGVVGPKVLDWEGRGVLLEVGSSSDRFGYAYSPLEEGEIDQGQYDRVREVLFVSSVAMLVARQAWSTVGPPDERFTSYHESLDFCWRAHLAGFRVVMTPAAVALHRGATLRGEREGSVAEATRRRYHRERGALASMLKNYSALSLCRVLPPYFLLGLARVVGLALARRLDEASQVLAAWGWNLLHLPGTLRRRRRVQSVRRVPDRVVRRSMAPAWIRLHRWLTTAAEDLLPRWARAAQADQPLRARLARVAAEHPGLVAWPLAAVLALVSYRGLLGAEPLVGGAIGSPPGSPSEYFRELASSVRSTGLGGAHPASPALGLLGVGSVLALGRPALLQKLLLLVLPGVAALAAFRAVRGLTDSRPAAVAAGALYGLSSPVLWALSTGRVEVLVFLAGAPWLVSKVSLAFEPHLRQRVPPLRWVAGAAAGTAALGSFLPGAALAAALVAAAGVLAPTRAVRRARGLGLCLLALAGAGLLTLPLTLDLVTTGGAGLGHRVPPVSFSAALRLAPGPGPGGGWLALCLPVGAALSLAFLPPVLRPAGTRAGVAAVAGVYLAWASAAGLLPEPVANAPVYAGTAAVGCALLVGMGLASLVPGVASAAFGHRQLVAGLMVLTATVGVGAQATQAARGAWEVGGPDRVPAAYALVREGARGGRVLWLGAGGGDAFPPPGGLPDGLVRAGEATVRYAVRWAGGASALDVGRSAGGAAHRTLETVLAQVLSGTTRHGGALLAPFGIRFVVADPGDLPEPAWSRLLRQVDLDPVPVGGLRVLENAKAVPAASVVADPGWAVRARGPALAAVDLPVPGARPFQPPRLEVGAGPGAMILLAQEFDPRWRLELPGGRALQPRRAFGWATAFSGSPVPSGSALSFGGQRAHVLTLGALALLWAAVMVITRRPPRRG